MGDVVWRGYTCASLQQAHHARWRGCAGGALGVDVGVCFGLYRRCAEVRFADVGRPHCTSIVV